jgi:nucleoside-diphosphate-sugar epimerase
MARILITGGAGYVGSHCAKALARSARVVRWAFGSANNCLRRLALARKAV